MAFLPALAATGFAVSVPARAGEFSGAVALGSQLVDRGLAITPATPVLQGAGSWTSSTGWSLGLSAGVEARSPGRLAEGMAQASHAWSLSSDWQMQASLLYYDYPSHLHSAVTDRTETGVNWTYRDILTLGVSAAWFIGARDNGPHPAADLGFHWPLTEHFSLSAGVGVAQAITSAYSSHGYYPGHEYGYGYAGRYGKGDATTYRYGHAGLMWSYGSWRVEVDRVETDLDSGPSSNDPSASPWLATITLAF
ncbi:hypothetical protein EZM97_15100 [Dyella soli]|uniref:MipA/OmpV family protein n=1 Tax=Dyella soli TaxID=522319 RepID=A0A4R0YY64_9GAMM|nr:hypothetical protein EZM97_15100 [Dyella soli]